MIDARHAKIQKNNIFKRERYYLINFTKIQNDLKERLKSEYLDSKNKNIDYFSNKSIDNTIKELETSKIFILIQKTIFTVDYNKFGQLLMLNDYRSENKIIL